MRLDTVNRCLSKLRRLSLAPIPDDQLVSHYTCLSLNCDGSARMEKMLDAALQKLKRGNGMKNT